MLTITLTMIAALAAPGDLLLVDFEGDNALVGLDEHGVTLFVVDSAGSQALEVASRHDEAWPGLVLKAPEGAWDLAGYRAVEVDVANRGENAVRPMIRVDNPGADGQRNCIQVGLLLAPGESGTLQALLPAGGAGPMQNGEEIAFVGMRGAPGTGGGAAFDPSNVTQILVFIPQPTEDHAFSVDNVRAVGQQSVRDWPDPFLPFIDEFGQFMHTDWPGKVHAVDELAKATAAEEADLAESPSPDGWDVWGGFADGPQLEATGFFRTEKIDGRWWLVDPDGRLFWSHGIDCVNVDAATPVSEREAYFSWLPPRDGALGAFYSRGSARHGYYAGRQMDSYDFGPADALRKYGEEWRDATADVAHRRLRSWGLNTIANWSDESIYLQGRTPYTVAVHFGGPTLAGSQGYWAEFRDVFDPDFAQAIGSRMAQEVGKSAGDPWCMGYFVDNEISWGSETSLAIAALTSPAEQPAKRIFVDDLTAKYETIEALNDAWGTNHASWAALLASTEPPDEAKADDDLRAFNRRTCEEYFGVIRDAVKAVAPDQLYLGCRLAWANPMVVEVAAEYCDVVSFNLYQTSVESFVPSADIDMPLIIGEFHFGALDRGMFHTGLVPVADQAARAAAYENYVRGALSNPRFVGCHWFKYQDEPTTGRPLDEENYQIGFIDICGTPYAETITAARSVGYELYAVRVSAGQ